jgi:hypothetical protein
MKTVFNNSLDVIHLFANKTQKHARCGNVFFKDKRIYSYGYHYLLGEFIDENTIVINNTGYSQTTSKHISQLISATSHKKRFYTTETDLKNVLYSIKTNVKKLKAARKPEMYISNSIYLFNKLNEFIKYTKNKNMLKSIEYKEIKTLIDAINIDPKNSIDALNKFEAKKAKIEKRQKEAQLKKEVEEFKNFKRNYLNFNLGFDFLRYNKETENIETSQGVKVSLNEAKRLVNLIDKKEVIGQKVNDTFLITACNGIFKAGCHTIDINEINFFRELLNI